MNDDIELRIERAQNDPSEMEQLLLDYLPFIKKQLSGIHQLLEYDDRLSIAMLTFINCVKQYTKGKGSFLSFVGICIHNRLIDENRKQYSYSSHTIPLLEEREETSDCYIEDAAALSLYDQRQEHEVLCEEIDNLNADLLTYGIHFQELSNICPKQERSRRQCLLLARTVLLHDSLRENLLRKKRLPQTELSEIAGVSVKTVEKHRKYIVTLILLLLGDYPAIRTYLPQDLLYENPSQREQKKSNILFFKKDGKR